MAFCEYTFTRTLIAAGIAGFAVAAFPHLPTAAAAGADIVLRKSSAAPEEISARRHIVRQGETLGGILAERGVRPRDLAAAIDLVLELNPAITAPRLIYPGQEILLPDRNANAGQEFSADRIPADMAGKEGPDGSTVEGLSSSGRLRTLLDSTLLQLDEGATQTGTLRLPLGDLGSIDIDGRSYPLIEFSTGNVVILDPAGGLPDGWAKKISDLWPSYAVLTSGHQEDLRTFLGGLLSLSGYHSVISGEAFTIGRDASVTIVPDFLVLKDPRSLMEEDVYLINIDVSRSASLPDEIRALASDHRIRVVDVIPSLSEVSSGLPSSGYAMSHARKLTSSNRLLLFRELASLLSLEIDDRLTIPGDSQPGSIIFSPGGSLILRRGSRNCLLYFHESDTSLELLAGPGMTPVYAGPETPLLPAIRKILESLDVDHRGPAIEFYRTRDRFHVTVPGLYLSGPEGPFFITDRDIGKHLSSFLVSSGIEVIRLALSGE